MSIVFSSKYDKIIFIGAVLLIIAALLYTFCTTLIDGNENPHENLLSSNRFTLHLRKSNIFEELGLTEKGKLRFFKNYFIIIIIFIMIDFPLFLFV